MSAQQNEISEFFPAGSGDWKQAGPDNIFDDENLYDHIDGGAELFISYGFTTACSRTYSTGGEAEISIDIFEMSDPKNAFGVFTHSRESVDHRIGQDCQIYEDAAIFWRNRYYVAITCFKCPDDIQDVLLDMANHISDAIGSDGPYPGLLSRLPDQGLREESILYFNHYAWQNAFYYFGDENYFNIDKDTDALLARYDHAGDQIYLMMIQYPGVQQAKSGLTKFKNEYLDEMSGQILHLEDSLWLGTDQSDVYVMVVFHAKTRTAVEDLLKSVREKL